MDYIREQADGQLTFSQSTDFLKIPSCLYGFHNTNTDTCRSKSGRTVFRFKGDLDASEQNLICSCGAKMHVNNHPSITLRHLPFGGYLTCVSFERNQYVCPKCHNTSMQDIPFKAAGHRITVELYQYARDLLALGTYTNNNVAELTGLGKNTVKDIDKQRLQELYTIDLIKQKLTLAYSRHDEARMAEDIISIMDLCKATGNPHFRWFERLLGNHFEGIIAHAANR